MFEQHREYLIRIGWILAIWSILSTMLFTIQELARILLSLESSGAFYVELGLIVCLCAIIIDRFQDKLTFMSIHNQGWLVGIASLVMFSPLLIFTMPFFLIVLFIIICTILILLITLVPQYWLSTAYKPLSIKGIVEGIFKARSLIKIWFTQQIRARYIQATLGILWLIFLPLIQSLVMAFALTKLLGVNDIGAPWVVYLLSGRTIFGIFQSIVLQSSNALISNNELMRKIYFPREILIYLIIGEVLLDFAIQFVTLMLIAFLYGLQPNIYYFFLPIPILLMVSLSMGIGFIVSWLNLVIRDIHQLIVISLQLLMYLTVLYARRTSGEQLAFMFVINPLLAITESFRDIILYAQMPNMGYLTIAAVLSVCILYPGFVLFKVNEDRFAEFS